MNTRLLQIALLASTPALLAEITPLGPTLPDRYPMSYLEVDHHGPMYEEDDWCFHWTVGATSFHREAHKGFSCRHAGGDSNEVPFGTLIFGKEEFTLAEAFPGGTVGQEVLAKTQNPFISATGLRPHYNYEESGAMFHAAMETQWCGWRFGLRTSLPFRSIEVSEACSADHNGLEFTGATSKDDLYQERRETIQFNAGETTAGAGQKTNPVFAARMDLLSAMNFIEFGSNGLQDQRRIVRYFQNAPTIIMVGAADVGQTPQFTQNPAGNTNVPPVAVIQRDDGTVPRDQRWGRLNTAITGPINSDGSGLSNNARGRFDRNTSYIPLQNNSNAQAELWVVPNLTTSQQKSVGGPGEVTVGARSLQIAIDEALGQIDNSVEDFIKAANLDFCSGDRQGAGDLDLEFYLGYDWTDCADIWSNVLFGIRVPTGEAAYEQNMGICGDQPNCRRVLQQPTGLNDHVGIRIGSEHGWDALDWLKLNIGSRYTFVINDEQKVAAPFAGATIKGIGPCVSACTQWGFFEGYVNTTMCINDSCYFDVSYQVYHQPRLDCSDVRLLQQTATDLAGRSNQQLSPRPLLINTERTSHKIHTAFHVAYECCYLNLGFSHALAGRNIMRDTDWYAGLSIDF